MTMTRFASVIDHVAGRSRSAMPGDVVEIPFLLPAWQAAQLETAAHRHGITTAQMVRRLILAWLQGAEASSPCDTA